MNSLPLHPSLRHPLTGEPLRAVYRRIDGRLKWPVMGGAPDGNETGGEGEGAADKGTENKGSTPENAVDDQGRDLGYPKDTPVNDMTDAQKAAFGRHKDEQRKAATREWKSVTGDRTPAQLKAELDELERLRKEKLTPSEKAIEDAKSEAKNAARSELLPQLAETAFRVAIGDRKTDEEVDEFIADLNLSRFIKDGRVDTARVLERVKQYAPEQGMGSTQQQRDFGQGSRGGNGTQKSGVAAGQAMFAERKKPINS